MKMADVARPVERRIINYASNGTHVAISISIEYQNTVGGFASSVTYNGGLEENSDLERLVRDAASLISLMLQKGTNPRAIARSLSEKENYWQEKSPGSILALMVRELSAAPKWAIA